MPQARERKFGLIFTGAALLLMFGDTVVAEQPATKENIQAAMRTIADGFEEFLLPALHGDTPMPFEENLSFKSDCLNQLKPGEPFFTLRGQDLLAATTVRHWAAEVSVHCGVTEKSREADALADAMDKWHPRKLPD